MRVATLRSRYDAGRLLHRVRYDDSRSGTRAIDDLGFKLDMHPSGLRAMARVAERIQPDQFERLVAVRCENGLPPTWSHLETLSKLSRRSCREAQAEALIGRLLSVEELKARVRAHQNLARSLRSADGSPCGACAVQLRPG